MASLIITNPHGRIVTIDGKDAEYYGYFMTALMGLVDDAELSGYDREALRHLTQARDLFMAEFLNRHPDAWKRD